MMYKIKISSYKIEISLYKIEISSYKIENSSYKIEMAVAESGQFRRPLMAQGRGCSVGHAG